MQHQQWHTWPQESREKQGNVQKPSQTQPLGKVCWQMHIKLYTLSPETDIQQHPEHATGMWAPTGPGLCQELKWGKKTGDGKLAVVPDTLWGPQQKYQFPCNMKHSWKGKPWNKLQCYPTAISLVICRRKSELRPALGAGVLLRWSGVNYCCSSLTQGAGAQPHPELAPAHWINPSWSPD